MILEDSMMYLVHSGCSGKERAGESEGATLPEPVELGTNGASELWVTENVPPNTVAVDACHYIFRLI